MKTRVLGFLLLLCWLLGTAQAQSLSLPSSALVGQNVTATITFSSTAIIEVTGIEWGDGSLTPVVNGALGSTKNLNHTYAVSGTFRARLTCFRPKNGSTKTNPRIKNTIAQNQSDPNCPQAFGVIVVSYPIPSLELTPNPAEPNQTVTAKLGSLNTGLLYTLDWGDGSSDTVVGKTSANLTHSYSTVKTYTVKLSEGRNLVPPQIVVLQVRRKDPVLNVSPSSVVIGEDVTATLSQLYSDVSYTLDWGDGSSDTITGLTSITRKKKYSTNGSKIIKLSATGLVPQVAPVVVNIPTPTLAVNPDDNKIGLARATIAGLAPSVTYTLDWGDDSPQETITQVPSANLQHTYPASGKPVYLVKLTYQGGLVTATISIASGCQIAFNPSVPNVNQQVQASVSGLVANTQYTIFWGDDTNNIISANPNGIATYSHIYTQTKIYTVQVKLDNKLICLGSLNVGGVTVVADIKVESASTTQEGLVIKSAYPDETVNIILEPLTVGESYTLDYGDARAKLSFKATEKKRVVPAWYTTEKQFTLTLIQKAKSVSTTLKVGLPLAQESLKLLGEARAKLPSQFETTTLLSQGNYELEFGDSSLIKLAKNPDEQSAIASRTYSKAGSFTLKLFWVGVQGTRIQRTSLPIQVLEAFTAEILGTSVYFNVSKNAVTKFDTIRFGASSTTNPAELTITYKGFGLLEGDVLTDGKPTSSLKINLAKNGGQDAGQGRRRLVQKLSNLVLTPIGTRKITFQPTKLNGAAFSSQADKPLEIFVYPKRFIMGNFEFLVKVATGSLSAMSGKANVHLVFLGKDFGLREVEFQKLEAIPLFDINQTTAQKTVYIPGDVIITKGSLQEWMGGEEFNTAEKLIIKLERIVFEPGTSKFFGAINVPYPTCPISPIITENAPPTKEAIPEPPSKIAELINKPYPSDLVQNILTDPAKISQVDQLGEAKFENLGLQQLAGLGAANLPVSSSKQLVGKARASKLVRTSQTSTLPKNPSLPNAVLAKSDPTVSYNYVVPLEGVKLDPFGGLYLDSVQGSIEGQVNLQGGFTYLKSYAAPNFSQTSKQFSLGCSGVMMPQTTKMTIDLSVQTSPSSDALLESFGGTQSPPKLDEEWRGVLFPKASNKLTFVDTTSYGAKAQSQGLSITDPIAANITYHGGYNWSISKAGVGAGVVNAWKFDISNFAMSMYHSKVVDGSGEGKFYLPFFVLDPRGRFFTGEVGTNVSQNWDIVTDEFIQKDFGSSSVVAGCGVFYHESGSYPIKFESAFWAVKRLVNAPSPITYKKPRDWQPLQTGEFRRTKGTIFASLKQHYAKMRANGNIDTESHCDKKETLKGKISTDAGVQIFMPNFRVFPDGNIDMNGQTWRSISAPNLEIAGQKLPANEFGVGKNPDGTHFIGLRSNSYRLAPCDQNNASDCLPAVSTEIRYPIQNGKDQGKVILKGFTIASNMNPNTKFKQTFPDKEIQLSGKLYALENAPNEIWLEKYSKNSGMGNLAAASNDFCFESSNSGFCPEPSPVSSASNTMDMGGIAVTAQMFVRRQNGKVSWGVYAGAISETPLASLFGVVNVYGLYGGIVYNKRWDANAAYNNLASDFAFSKLQDASGLQVVAGTVFTVLDGSSFHGAGVLFVDLSSNFAVTINVTGWLLTPYAQNSGYLGNETPHARALIQINSSGLSADLCVGNTGTPPNAKIQCQGLANLKLSKVAEVQGYASLAVGSQNHIYIGTFKNPITLTVFPESSAFKTQATGYIMIGQVDSNAGIPDTAKASQGSVTGLYAGFGIKRDIQVGDSGSINLLVTSCKWSWYAKAGWAVSADFGLTIKPDFEMGAAFSASAYAGAGVSGCGVGIDIGITGSISGTIKVSPSSAVASYKFSGSISTPSPLPDINFSKSGDLDLY